MIVIGIVGPPAGGKSTVARQLVEMGAVWLDADRLAHQVLNQESVIEALVGYFGLEVLEEGKINRKWLATQVFGDDLESRQRLQWLEAVVHPPTRLLLQQKLIEATKNGVPAAVLDVPLLFESNWDVYCDQIWCLVTPLQKRQSWLHERGWTVEELKKREARQLPISEKKRLSTHILQNDGSSEELRSQVAKLAAKIGLPVPNSKKPNFSSKSSFDAHSPVDRSPVTSTDRNEHCLGKRVVPPGSHPFE